MVSHQNSPNMTKIDRSVEVQIQIRTLLNKAALQEEELLGSPHSL